MHSGQNLVKGAYQTESCENLQSASKQSDQYMEPDRSDYAHIWEMPLPKPQPKSPHDWAAHGGKPVVVRYVSASDPPPGAQDHQVDMPDCDAKNGTGQVSVYDTCSPRYYELDPDQTSRQKTPSGANMSNKYSI